MHNINIIFFGSSGYSLPLIESLHAHFDLTLIVTRPDKPVGRKQTLTPSKPKQYAQSHEIPVISPESLTQNTDSIINTIRDVKPTIAVVADYGLIIPPSIFTLPTYQTMNIHFSNLPEFRGASPVQYTILSGRHDAWISYMLLEESLDTGPVVHMSKYPVSHDATTGSLYTDLFQKASVLLPDVITRYIEKQYIPAPQSPVVGEAPSRAPHIRKRQAFIPWESIQHALAGTNIEKNDRPEFLQQFDGTWQEVVERAIRAFTPWPIAWTEVDINGQKKRLQLVTSHVTNNSLILDTVKLEGKSPVPFVQFQTAYSI